MSFTNAQLAQQIANLIEYWAAFNQEYSDWIGGTVSGGPNSDGEYPLTNWAGEETLLPCPAKLSDNVTGYVATVAASASAASDSEIAAALSETNAAASAVTATAQAVLADADRVAAELAESGAVDAKVTAIAQAAAAVVSAAAALASEQAAAASEAAAAISETNAAASAAAAATFDPDLFYKLTDSDVITGSPTVRNAGGLDIEDATGTYGWNTKHDGSHTLMHATGPAGHSLKITGPEYFSLDHSVVGPHSGGFYTDAGSDAGWAGYHVGNWAVGTNIYCMLRAHGLTSTGDGATNADLKNVGALTWDYDADFIIGGLAADRTYLKFTRIATDNHVQVRDGGIFRVYDATNTDYFQIKDSGSNTQITSNNNSMQVSAGGGKVDFINGTYLQIRDSINAKNLQISHDGTQPQYTTATGMHYFNSEWGMYVKGTTYSEVSSAVISGTADYAELIARQEVDGTNVQLGLSGSTAAYHAGDAWLYSAQDFHIDTLRLDVYPDSYFYSDVVLQTGKLTMPNAKYIEWDDSVGTPQNIITFFSNDYLYVGNALYPMVLRATTIIHQGLETHNSINTFTYARSGINHPISMESANPFIRWLESDQVVDGGGWHMGSAGGNFYFRSLNDAGTNLTDIFIANRTGATVNKVTFGVPIEYGGQDSDDWNTAFGWGNHASAGYLSSTGIGDIAFSATIGDRISLYDNRLDATNMYGFGVESGALYSKSPTYHRWYVGVNADVGTTDTMELDTTGLTVNGTIDATGGGSANWNTAFGWGDHSTQDYAVTTGDTFTGGVAINNTGSQLTLWESDGVDTLDKWVVDFNSGVLNFYFYDNSTVTWKLPLKLRPDASLDLDGVNINGTSVGNWNTAFGWGNHADSAYLPKSAGASHALTGSLYLGGFTTWVGGTYQNIRSSHATISGTRYYNSAGTQLGYGAYFDGTSFGMLTASGAWALNITDATKAVGFYGNLTTTNGNITVDQNQAVNASVTLDANTTANQCDLAYEVAGVLKGLLRFDPLAKQFVFQERSGASVNQLILNNSTATFIGTVAGAGDFTGASANSRFGYNTSSTFTYDGDTLCQYGMSTYNEAAVTGVVTGLSGYSGLRFFRGAALQGGNYSTGWEFHDDTTITGILEADDLRASGYGAVGTPTFSTQVDTDTGMYGESSNVLAFSTAGVRRLQLYDAWANYSVPVRSSGANTVPPDGYSSISTTMLHVDGKEGIDGADTWLRLNQNGDFTSGVYTPGKMQLGLHVIANYFETTGLGPLTTPGTDDLYAGGYGIMGSRITGFYVSNVAGPVKLVHANVHGATGVKLETSAAGLYSTGVIDVGHATDTTLSRLAAAKLGVEGKALLKHAGSYTSGEVTFSTSAPSGGSNGDIWYEYT